ncbi:helix-turn-helix transcriptional regulator [Lichenihabitans sp. Uapishka_5]|uniref:helix-turn-helix domain-containing protein n=1 Tax=Lichenihabitans sp. Uapishka_5 TaxID=3037302 RepID=UPI0029E7CBDC|nr:helix-turn-helix transcriptional regulator [Lichenihabitans sp. Uapishka_5]MDX7951256.1 helix-turn-helix transcriptional regulator [Lichenihabitans sp. Uapishka_5]
MDEHAREERARAARMLFAANLRRLRRDRGLTQEGLSLESGLRQSYLSEIEAGKRNVSIDNIGVLAHALGVTIGRLFD